MDFKSGEMGKPGSYTEAIKGCEGVFICGLESQGEPERIEKVEAGMKHVLQSCLMAKVDTVIITSSTGTCL